MDRHKLEEAIKHGKEMLDVFGGEHAEFIKVAIECIDFCRWFLQAKEDSKNWSDGNG